MADPFSAFGPAESGVRLAEQDMAALAMQPLRMQQLAGSARYSNARAELAEQQAASHRRFAEFAASANPQVNTGATNEAPRNPMWNLADAAFRAGMPDSYKYANVASLIDTRAQTAETQQARAAEYKVNTSIKLLDTQARLITGVKDDASLLAFAKDFYETTGAVPKFNGQPLLDGQGNLTVQYSPELVGRMRAQAVSEKDKILMDFRERSLNSADRERRSKQSARAFWENMDNQYEREAARQRARGEKNGTKLFPTPSEIKAGSDYLEQKFGIDKSEPWSRVHGRELIDNAKRLRERNPALSTKDALDQAFQDMDRAGAFAGRELVDKKDQQGRLDRAIPLPDKKEDLKIGQLYRDDTGQVREWTKDGWSMATQRIGGGGPLVTGGASRNSIRELDKDDDDPDVEDDDEED